MMGNNRLEVYRGCVNFSLFFILRFIHLYPLLEGCLKKMFLLFFLFYYGTTVAALMSLKRHYYCVRLSKRLRSDLLILKPE
jgi:hypothetical protein